MTNSLRILIMAGGTGGHVFPGLAVAETLLESGHHVQWLGTKRGIESKLVPAKNIALNYIEIEGIRGKGIFIWFKLPWLLLRAIMQANKIIKKLILKLF